MELDIRGLGLNPTPAFRREIARRLRHQLRSFEARLERVTVRLVGDHGRRRHAARGCLVTVAGRGIPPVRAEQWHLSIRAAIALASAQARRGLARAVDRRRTHDAPGMTWSAASFD